MFNVLTALFHYRREFWTPLFNDTIDEVLA